VKYNGQSENKFQMLCKKFVYMEDSSTLESDFLFLILTICGIDELDNVTGAGHVESPLRE
jgi:hypothetical protein